MTKLYFLRAGWALTAAIMLLMACSKDDDSGEDDEPQNIVTTAKEEGNLNLFVEALEKTSLDANLTQGTYTLFAPNDEMFQAFIYDLGFDNVENLINGIGEARTRQILLYHVLEGTAVRADEIGNAYVATAAENKNGNRLSLYTTRIDTVVNLNGNAATVVKRDIDAGNGIIHKTSGVLTLPTITLLLSVHPDFTTLVQAMRNAEGNLTTSFRQENLDATLFAPGNDAFAAFFNDSPEFNDFNDFFQKSGPQKTRDFVLYHALEKNQKAEDLATAAYQTMLDGTTVSVEKDANGNISITANGGTSADVVNNNIIAVNGSIHRINYVLSPQ